MGRSSQSESDVRRWTHKDLVVDCEELREVRDRGEYRRLRLLGILALLSNSTLLRTWALLCSLGMQEKKALSSRGRGRLRGFLELRRPWGFSPEAPVPPSNPCLRSE